MEFLLQWIHKSSFLPNKSLNWHPPQRVFKSPTEHFWGEDKTKQIEYLMYLLFKPAFPHCWNGAFSCYWVFKNSVSTWRGCGTYNCLSNYHLYLSQGFRMRTMISCTHSWPTFCTSFFKVSTNYNMIYHTWLFTLTVF